LEAFLRERRVGTGLEVDVKEQKKQTALFSILAAGLIRLLPAFVTETGSRGGILIVSGDDARLGHPKLQSCKC